MVEKEKIKKLVKEVVDKNKLQSCFIPIIEEFFFRVADQLNWNDEELKNSMRFDVDDLEGILEFDKDKIENFINTAMHEQGHAIQYQKKKMIMML